MSLIGLAMNGLLAVLLLAALGMGMRLNRRLKALRDSHDGFATAVADLNQAAARAEQGLADLRSATDEAVDLLADRIEKGRSLAMKLERLIEHAQVPQRPAAPPVDDPVAERRLGALLAAAREARPERIVPPLRSPAAASRTVDAPAPSAADRLAARILQERQAPRGHRFADEELFADDALTLDVVHGARR